MTPDSLPVRVSPYLAGSKRAVMLDGVLFVSPAMMDLLTHAEGDELLQLVASIPVLNLGSSPSIKKRMADSVSD